MDCSMPGLPVHYQLPEFTQTHVHWVDDAIQASHSLLSPSPPAFNVSQHQSLFKWVSSSHLLAKVLEFHFSISSSYEYSGLISFRINCLDLFAVQQTFRCLLQHHSLKASVLRCSVFFIVQLSHPTMTIGKTISLTRWTCVGQVMFLLFNMPAMLVITSSKEQASFNFMAAVTICSDFGAQKNKVCHCSNCFPIYLPWGDRTRCHDLSFLNVWL